MYTKKSSKLLSLLVEEGVPPVSQTRIINGLYGTTETRSKHNADTSWEPLLHCLRTDKSNVQSNRNNWAAGMAPIYDEYIGLLSAIRERIEKARSAPDTPKLAQYTQQILTKNRKRATDGKPSVGDCNANWASWIPPHIRKAFADRVAFKYIEMGRSGGTMFTPFVTRALKQRIRMRVDTLRSTMLDTRRACSCEAGTHVAPDNWAANTPYKALYLAAVRMAERELYRRTVMHEHDGLTMLDVTIPVHWKHLLTAEMRARLLAGDDMPFAVTLDGLDNFYDADARDRKEALDDGRIAVQQDVSVYEEAADGPL